MGKRERGEQPAATGECLLPRQLWGEGGSGICRRKQRFVCAGVIDDWEAHTAKKIMDRVYPQSCEVTTQIFLPLLGLLSPQTVGQSILSGDPPFLNSLFCLAKVRRAPGKRAWKRTESEPRSPSSQPTRARTKASPPSFSPPFQLRTWNRALIKRPLGKREEKKRRRRKSRVGE